MGLIDGFEPKPLSHGGPLWGYLFLGFILHRRPTDGYYEEPTEATVRRVVIKRLLKPVVDDDLRRGSRENPCKYSFCLYFMEFFGYEKLTFSRSIDDRSSSQTQICHQHFHFHIERQGNHAHATVGWRTTRWFC